MTPDKQLQAWREEEQRQSSILAKAIDDAIHATSKQFETPILNALAGALISNEAAIVASIEDPVQRKALRKAMERMRPVAIAQASARATKFAQTVTIGGVRQ